MVSKKRLFEKKNFNMEKLKFGFFTLAFSIFILTFLIPLISATFSVGNPKHGLGTVYGPSENVTGWINISFSSEPINSVFSDSRDHKINLSGILGKNTLSYSCSPVDCEDGYAVNNPEQTKTITLDSGDSKIYGVKLTGNVFAINSFKFTLESTAGASCTNQVEIDLLDDSVLDERNRNSTEQSCTNLKDYGCFNAGNPNIEEFSVSTTPYCEKVDFSSSPSFFIGGWLKNVSGSRTVKAYVYDTDGVEIGNCILPNPSSSGQEVFCNINYSVVSPQEGYVRISSTSGSGEYRVRGYGDEANGCGFHATPI